MNIMPAENIREAKDFALANDLSGYLSGIYPNHRWAVGVDSSQGIVKIRELDLMENTHFYVIRLAEVKYSAKKMMKMLMVAGGEILERFTVSRERQKRQTIYDTIKSKDPDFAGRILFDANGVPNYLGEHYANL